MDNYIWIWIATIILFVIVELITAGLTTIWFAAGAVLSLLAAILNWPLYAQLIIFAVSSILLLVFTRPVLLKKMKITAVTNINSIIGETGIVTSDIKEFDTGLVKVKGQIWTALSTDGSFIIKGTKITVDHIEGVKLIVRPVMINKNKE